MDSSVKQLKNICIENNYNRSMYYFDRAAIIHRDEIINAYNQGYREGQEDSTLCTLNGRDVSQFSNGKDYYNNTFKK